MRNVGNDELELALIEKISSGNNFSLVEVFYQDPSDGEFYEEENLITSAGVTFTETTNRDEYANYGLQPAADEASFQVLNVGGAYGEGSGEPEEDRYFQGQKIKIVASYINRGELLDEDDEAILNEGDAEILATDVLFSVTWIYYIDEVVFGNESDPEEESITINCSSVYKRVMDGDYIFKDLSGLRLDEVLKDALDQNEVPYSATSIDQTTDYDTRTLDDAPGTAVSADETISKIMQILQARGKTNYEIYPKYDATFEDMIIFLKPYPTDLEVDFAYTDNKITSAGTLKKNQNRRLRRFSVFSEEPKFTPRILLASGTYAVGDHVVSLGSFDSAKRKIIKTGGDGVVSSPLLTADSFSFTVSGASVDLEIYGAKFGGEISSAVQVSGSGLDDMSANAKNYTGGANKVYVIEIDGTGTPDTFKISEDGGATFPTTEVEMTGEKQAIGDGITVTFKDTTGHTLADAWQFIGTVDRPASYGEHITAESINTGSGIEYESTNELLTTDTEATEEARGLGDLYGDPLYEFTNITLPTLNLFIEKNDLVFPFLRNRFVYRIYRVSAVRHYWEEIAGNDPGEEYTEISVYDSGLTWGDIYPGGFIADQGLYNLGENLKTDNGLVADMTLGPNATDEEITAYYNSVVKFQT